MVNASGERIRLSPRCESPAKTRFDYRFEGRCTHELILRFVSGIMEELSRLSGISGGW